GRQRRAGRAERPKGRQVELVDRTKAGLETCVDVRRGDPEVSDAMFLRAPPQRAEVGVARAAVVQNHRRTGQQTGDEQVPHHPTGSGEPGETLAWAEIVMQPER